MVGTGKTIAVSRRLLSLLLGFDPGTCGAQ